MSDLDLRARHIQKAYARLCLQRSVASSVANSFDEQVSKQKKLVQNQLHRAIENLTDKAKGALENVGLIVNKTSVDVDRAFDVTVSFDVMPGATGLFDDDLVDLIESTLGDGWLVTDRGRHWHVEYAG